MNKILAFLKTVWESIDEALGGDYTMQQETPNVNEAQIAPVEPVAPQVTPKPTVPPKILLWAQGIAQNEGAEPSSNNPGNLKYSTLTASWGATKGRQATDGGYLCQFASLEQGTNALQQFLILGADDQLIAFHNARSFQAFTVVYAGNPPLPYIQRIAATVGCEMTTLISTFLE